MKKKIFGMLIAFATIASGSVYAQTQQAKDKSGAKPECCIPAAINKNKQAKPKFNPFDGVQLTSDQQQRLQVLRQGLGPVKLSKEEMEKLSDEQKKQMRQENKAKKAEAKKKYLSGVKEILTPEQYVIFLENVYLYQPEKGKGNLHGNKKMKGKKNFKGDVTKKKENKGNKDKMASKGEKKSKRNKAQKAA